MSEENIATSRRVLDEAWMGGNLEVIDETATDDFVDHDPIEGDRDVDAVKRGIEGYRAAFPDLEIEVVDAIAAGDKVVLRWRSSGTFENEFMGIAPTGQKLGPFEGISIDRFEGGKIAEAWAQWNVLAFMQSIGAIPTEQAAAAAAG
jgi:predicted ester cyclase